MPASLARVRRRVRGPYRRVRRRLGYWVEYGAAWLWRRLMLRTTVIAVTGSAGKTTTTACLARMLEDRADTHRTRDNDNGRHGVLRTVLALRPWQRFAVIEVGTDQAGMIARQARVVRPDVAIVLCVGQAHMSAFRSLDRIAEEKGQLVRSLSRRGVAVLNHDDERVRAMAACCRGRVRFFGRGADAELVAQSVHAGWPGRLTLEVRCGAQRTRVRTQLVGTHWTGSVLAALLAAHECRVPLAEAAAALATLAPPRARLEPLRLPGGVTALRDEGVASPESIGPLFEVLAGAGAARRVLVAGDVTASTENTRKRLRALGALAAQNCEVALFVGSHAHHAVRGAIAAGMDPRRCHDLIDARAAAERLRDELQSGDLVAIKGRSSEHLSRVLFAQYGEIGCWKSECGIRLLCDHCGSLRPAFDLEAELASGARAVHWVGRAAT